MEWPTTDEEWADLLVMSVDWYRDLEARYGSFASRRVLPDSQGMIPVSELGHRIALTVTASEHGVDIESNWNFAKKSAVVLRHARATRDGPRRPWAEVMEGLALGVAANAEGVGP